MSDAQQEVQAQDDAAVEAANAQLVQEEASTTEAVTPEQLGVETVAQSEGLAQPVAQEQQEDVGDTVSAESADTGGVPADPAPAPMVEPPLTPQVVPLSKTAENVRAWVELMRLTAPHQSQKAFSDHLDENIASFDQFVQALGE